MAHVLHRNLGSSDLKLSPIGLGAWQFSRGNGLIGKYWPAMPDDRVREIVETTLRGGVNWIDTAEIYGNGESEKALAAALQSLSIHPGEVYVATKWWPFLRTARSLQNSIGNRLHMLDPYPIDLYQIHQPFSVSSIHEQMKAMAKLQNEGKIRYAGVSNFSAKQLKAAHHALAEHGIALISNQVKYSLLDRKIEDNGILDTAKELGVSIIAYSPLEQGILTGKFHEDPERLKSVTGVRKFQRLFRKESLQKTEPLIARLTELAKKYQVTPSQVALQWLISFHGDVVFAIPGATNAKQATENTGALHFLLLHEELKELDILSRAVLAVLARA